MHGIGLYGTNIRSSQKWAYLHSLRYPFFAPCLVYVRHKFDRRWARQLCALGRRRILKINHAVCIFVVELVELVDIQFHESGLCRVGHVRMIKDSTKVIPCGGVIRGKRNLSLGKSLKG